MTTASGEEKMEVRGRVSDDITRTVEAVVCIPTFRRPDWLERTLQSVLEQQTPFLFAIVVVDNDGANPEGAERARRLLAEGGVPHAIFVETKQGNCHAINRAFTEAMTVFAEAEFFLMIDDDEIAMPGWLAAMVALARQRNCDVVGGPVDRIFEAPVADAVAAHPLFQSIHGKTRPIEQIHGSGNCLMRRRVFEHFPPPPFDARFNFLGGGDMEFFTRCHKVGFTTWWCEEAKIKEFVPAERLTSQFLMKRSLRTGSINYAIDRLSRSGAYLAAKNVASLALSIGRALGLLIRSRSLVVATHPVLMSVGRVIASLGFLPQPYKAADEKLPIAERGGLG